MQRIIYFFGPIAAVGAALALCSATLNPTTYLISCTVVPLMLALALRYVQNWEHASAALIAFASAIGIGSALLAYGSYWQTFHQGAQGFLVGGGWNSVGASAIFGALIGLFGGIAAVVAYLVVASMIGRAYRGRS